MQAGAVFLSFQLVWIALYFARMIRHVCGMCYLFRRMLYKAVGAMKLLTYISKNTREVNQMKHRMQTEIYHHGFCFNKLS